MKAWISKYKWPLSWLPFGLGVAGTIWLAVFFEDKTWLPNVLQTASIVLGIYLSLIVYLHSLEQSKKGTEEQIRELQRLNNLEIEAMRELFQKQIDSLTENTDKQMNHFQELTEKQIETIQQSTYDQISAFEKQTNGMIQELSENTYLLAEILGRQLEDAILDTDNKIANAERVYSKLKEFQVGRNLQEKNSQLKTQVGFIEYLKNLRQHFTDKYNSVQNFLNGNEQQQLDE